MKLNLNQRAVLLSFFTAFVTLANQILVHRIISVKLLNNYAFLVISLTMLGFALSGVILTRWLKFFIKNFNAFVTASSVLFSVTLLAATVIFYHIPLGPQFATSSKEFIKYCYAYMPLAILYAVPFVFCGLILGALLSSKDFVTRQVYFFDLLGSSLGALGVLGCISFLGVETSLILSTCVLMIATFVLFPPKSRFLRFALYAALLVNMLLIPIQSRVFEMRYPASSMLVQNSVQIEHIAWDPVARIEVSKYALEPWVARASLYPSLISTRTELLKRYQKLITQNNFAFTFAVAYDGKKESLEGIDTTLYAAAYRVSSVPHPKVCIIGVGGGFDVLNALYFDASDITGVEVNKATVHILRHVYHDYFRHWVDDPRVRLVYGEGRHYLENSGQKYDVIQLSGTDTYAGTPGAVNIFSESYLYTLEAMRLFWGHLTPDGIISVLRLEAANWPREMLRMTTTAVQVLREQGIEDPSKHIATVTSSYNNMTSLLIKKTPFTTNELQKLKNWTSQNEFFYLSSSGEITPDKDSWYQRFLNIKNPGDESLAIRGYPFNIKPATDDKPFFFRYSRWSHLFSKHPAVALYSIPATEYTITLLSGFILLLVLVCIFVPLRILTRASPVTVNRFKLVAYFACLGVGYLCVEIAFMQKFGLILGHPNYAVSVVLASMLFSSGLGALFSQTILKRLKEIRYVSYLLALTIYAVVYLFKFLPLLMGMSFILKFCVVFAFVFPAGFLMGTYMPLALEQLKQTAPAAVPWAWGINGIFSVLGPILCIAWSVTFGISSLLLVAVPVYLAAGYAASFYAAQKVAAQLKV